MKILTAMSGGVDSSVTAYLLKSQGHEQIGAMMKLFFDDALGEISQKRACCTISDADDARAVANLLDIPFYIFNFSEAFSAEVMERFVLSYEKGETPNPCIDCNRYMKFQKFLRRAEELDCEKIATGHYARITETSSGRFLLKRGVDTEKDQSYVLYAMTQEQLAKTVFPLGALTKDEVREIAASQGFVNAEKRDSQDICFAPKRKYVDFIIRRTEKTPQKGHFINRNGKIMGAHDGIIHYTVGQRRGLGITSPEPIFVTGINAEANTVSVGASEELFAKKLDAYDVNFIPFDKTDGALRVKAKTRYSHIAQAATLWQTAPDRVHMEFDHPQRAITPGQAVVFYDIHDNETVVGGATIER